MPQIVELVIENHTRSRLGLADKGESGSWVGPGLPSRIDAGQTVRASFQLSGPEGWFRYDYYDKNTEQTLNIYAQFFSNSSDWVNDISIDPPTSST